MTLLKREEIDSPRPLMGEGEGERVKKCKRRLESNHPLSLTLSHGACAKNRKKYKKQKTDV